MYAINWVDQEEPQVLERGSYETARSYAESLWESGVQDIEIVYRLRNTIIYKFKNGQWIK